MAEPFYAIDDFPDDDRLWRIEWIGGVGYNTSVPSEPLIDVSLAQFPKGERNPLSGRARSSQVEKRTVKIGVGLLPVDCVHLPPAGPLGLHTDAGEPVLLGQDRMCNGEPGCEGAGF